MSFIINTLFFSKLETNYGKSPFSKLIGFFEMVIKNNSVITVPDFGQKPYVDYLAFRV